MFGSSIAGRLALIMTMVSMFGVKAVPGQELWDKKFDADISRMLEANTLGWRFEKQGDADSAYKVSHAAFIDHLRREQKRDQKYGALRVAPTSWKIHNYLVLSASVCNRLQRTRPQN